MHRSQIGRVAALALAAALCGTAATAAVPATRAEAAPAASQVASAQNDYGVGLRVGVFTAYAGLVGNQLKASSEPGVDYELTFDDSVTDQDFANLSKKLGTTLTADNEGVLDLQVNLDDATGVRDVFGAGVAYSTNEDVVAVSNNGFSSFMESAELLATGHGSADVWVTYAVHLDGDNTPDGYVTKVIRVTVPDGYQLHKDVDGYITAKSKVTISGFEPAAGQGVTYAATNVSGKLTASYGGSAQAKIAWSSSDPTLMTVDQGGNVKALGREGLVVIRAESGGECAYRLFQLADAKPVTMYRLYNKWTGEHFYTSSANERASLKGLGWTDEGVGWIAPSAGAPVYRLYNPYVTGGDHHYTMDQNEYNQLAALGWRQEGVGWRSADKGAKGSVPLYRQYNPYATTGTHNYTADKNENDTLVKAGWKAEGVAWYGMSEK